jgi:hypothetical protein
MSVRLRSASVDPTDVAPHPLAMRVMILVAVALAVGGVGVACGSTAAPGGATSTSASSSTGTGGGVECAGTCAPPPPAGWDAPALVWMGTSPPSSDTCPADAASGTYDGFGALNVPSSGCGPCACGSPTCSLPTTITDDPAACPASALPPTSFDPPAGWTGTCDGSASASGVGSFTVGPTASSCAPSLLAPLPAPTWEQFARRCEGASAGAGACATAGEACLPPPPPGFRVCVLTAGDADCAAAPAAYATKYLFYQSFQDTRACSACACGAPGGASCSTTVSVFADGACSALVGSATVDATGSVCTDLPPGTPLGSKSAAPATISGGSCAPSGGALSGQATPVTPSTLCCAP